jgi:hypothetical protein
MAPDVAPENLVSDWPIARFERQDQFRECRVNYFGLVLACVFDFRSGRNRLLRIERRKSLDHGYPAKLLVGSSKHRYQTSPFQAQRYRQLQGIRATKRLGSAMID